MKTIAAAEFKAKCLALLDETDPEGLTITKHGVPVAKLVPIPRTLQQLIGSLKDHISITDPTDDLFSTGIRWKAQGPAPRARAKARRR